tara:strand:- start:507 stop:716 length:210 start_codon:yes stop_codon:yes gene_type:complete
MYGKNYLKSIELFKTFVKNHKIKSGLPEYYIGAMYITLGDISESCKALSIAIQKGYNPAKALFQRTCPN